MEYHPSNSKKRPFSGPRHNGFPERPDKHRKTLDAAKNREMLEKTERALALAKKEYEEIQERFKRRAADKLKGKPSKQVQNKEKSSKLPPSEKPSNLPQNIPETSVSLLQNTSESLSKSSQKSVEMPGKSQKIPSEKPAQSPGNPSGKPAQPLGNPSEEPAQPFGNPSEKPAQPLGGPSEGPAQSAGNLSEKPRFKPSQNTSNLTAQPPQTTPEKSTPGRDRENPIIISDSVDQEDDGFEVLAARVSRVKIVQEVKNIEGDEAMERIKITERIGAAEGIETMDKEVEIADVSPVEQIQGAGEDEDAFDYNGEFTLTLPTTAKEELEELVNRVGARVIYSRFEDKDAAKNGDMDVHVQVILLWQGKQKIIGHAWEMNEKAAGLVAAGNILKNQYFLRDLDRMGPPLDETMEDLVMETEILNHRDPLFKVAHPHLFSGDERKEWM